jgi:4-hydroxy-3-methylbut-2-en-1-yl diphosphate reductase
MAVERVLLAQPRGFCAGVEMAIKALSWMVRTFDAPVYCYHEIVHNRLVVDRFIDLGVIFVDDVSEVPEGAPLMLSAHGTAPEVVTAAKANGGFVVNAVCPLVTKVHHEAKVRAGRGFNIIYVGHEGHDEAVGTMAVAPDAMHLVEKPEHVDALNLDGPVALLAQTTLSHHDWADVLDAAKAKFPDMWQPGRSDLCYATTNRQNALMAMAPRCDAIVVIGSANSSNTVALAKVAVAAGCERVVRVNAASELPDDLAGVVGVTAGASAPEELVEAVIARLAPTQGVEPVNVTEEDEYFPTPRELREAMPALANAVAFGLWAAPPSASILADDRTIAASDVLRALSGPLR